MVGSPLGAMMLIDATSSGLGEGGAGATGLALVLLALTQIAVGAVVAAVLAVVTAARLAALGSPRWWELLGAAPAALALLAAAWPPVALIVLPADGSNGLGFGMALMLWLLPDRLASKAAR